MRIYGWCSLGPRHSESSGRRDALSLRSNPRSRVEVRIRAVCAAPVALPACVAAGGSVVRPRGGRRRSWPAAVLMPGGGTRGLLLWKVSRALRTATR